MIYLTQVLQFMGAIRNKDQKKKKSSKWAGITQAGNVDHSSRGSKETKLWVESIKQNINKS